MDQFIQLLALKFGISAEMLPLYLGIIIAVANLIGKRIPSSAIGWLGVVRKVCLAIGLYIPQRVTATVSTKNVAEAVAASVPDASIKDAAESLPSAIKIGTNFGNLAAEIVATGTPGAAYVEGQSPEPGSLVPDSARTDGPFAAQKKRTTKGK